MNPNKLKIGFVTSPLSSDHSSRGVGYYVKYLLEVLIPLAKKEGHEIVEITDPKHLPEIDLLHYPFFDLFFPTLPLNHSVPIVVTIHDVIPLEFPDRYPPGIRGTFNNFLQRLALRQSRLVLTDSYASVQSIRQHLHVPHEKIRLVYLASAPQFKKVADRKRLEAVAKKYHLPKQFVLYVGDVNWNKNLYGLVAATKNLNVPLVLAGKQSGSLDKFNFQHAELAHLKPLLDLINSPNSKVQRLGFVPDADIVELFNLASVYCTASFAEGFGLPVLQAMACGTPVACSKTHSLPEIAGEAASYFDPYSIESITWAINQILKNKSVAEKFSAAGLMQVKKFSWDYTAKNTLLAYQEALSR